MSKKKNNIYKLFKMHKQIFSQRNSFTQRIIQQQTKKYQKQMQYITIS